MRDRLERETPRRRLGRRRRHTGRRDAKTRYRRRHRLESAAGAVRRVRRQPQPSRSRSRSRRPEGLLVACLRATGRPSVRDQSAGGGPLSRPALSCEEEVGRHRRLPALANILRTDVAAHRPLPEGFRGSPRRLRCSPEPSRTRSGTTARAHNKLRSQLREFYPAILAAFADKRERHLLHTPGPDHPGRGADAHQRRPASPATDVCSPRCSNQAGRLRGIESRSRPAPRRSSTPSTSTDHPWSRMPSRPGRPPPCYVQLEAACHHADQLEAATGRLSRSASGRPDRLQLSGPGVPDRGPGSWPRSAMTGLVFTDRHQQ